MELAAGTVTLGGGGSYTFQGGVGGNQALRLQGGGLKQFKEAVSVTGITQSASEVARFEKNVSTTSTSAFAGSVVLDEMVFDAQGNTSFADVSLATGEVTLQGAGAYTVNGAVSGGKDFVLLGGGTKTFASSLVVGKLTQTEGQIVLSGNVAASGLVNLADLSVRGEVMIDSANQNQTYGTILLGRNGATAGRLTADAGTGALVIGSTALARSKALAQAKAQGKRSTARAGADTTVVSGSGDLEVYADALVINGVIANQGAFGAFKPTGNLYLGDYTNPYLTSLSSIRSTAGVGFGALNGDLEARSLSSDYDLGLLASGDLIIESLTAKKELALVAENGQVTANGTSTAGLLNLSAQGVVGLENIRAQGFGTVDFTQPYDLQYETSGSFVTTGSINVRGGSVFISSGGTFVNSTGNNNPFGRDANVTIYSRELFNPQLQGAFIPGARLIRGTPPAQLAATSRAVGEVGSGAVTIYYDNVNNLIPYSREFTTGTGQPYVLATQNAVAGAMAPVAYSVAGAFPTKAAYTSEEIEMMTPQERAAYEASQRKQSAEVILQKKAGEPATTVPTDGKVPQAKVQETGQPAPTAQVELEGKPLAGVPAKEKNDSTQLLRVRPSKGLALQSDSDLQSVMEDERLAAEVNVSAAPVAGR